MTEKEYKNWANILLRDMETHKLQVVLVPAPEPKFPDHMIRVAIDHNPYWYSELYYIYNYRRETVINELKELKKTGKPKPDSPLIEVIKQMNEIPIDEF